MRIAQLRARLLGIRVVEQTPNYIVLKVPRWFGNRSKRNLSRRVALDARQMHRSVKVSFSPRRVRVDVLPASPHEVIANAIQDIAAARKKGSP